MAPHADPDTTTDDPTPDAPSPDMRRLTTPPAKTDLRRSHRANLTVSHTWHHPPAATPGDPFYEGTNPVLLSRPPCTCMAGMLQNTVISES